MLVEVEIILVCSSTNATINRLYRRWSVDKVPIRLVHPGNVELSIEEMLPLIASTTVLAYERPFVLGLLHRRHRLLVGSCLLFLSLWCGMLL